MRVMVTRPAAEAAGTAARLRALGHQPILEPLLTVSLRGEPIPQGPFDALIVTSGNALRAAGSRPEAAFLASLPLVAIGRRTAALAREHGFADVTEAGPDVGALLAFLAEAWTAPHHALYLAGADRSVDLGHELARLGHRVTMATVYDATPVERFSAEARHLLLAGEIDVVLHYSARTVEAFLSCAREEGVDLGRSVRHLCLSGKVADVLARAGIGRVSVACRPEEDALLALLPSGASQEQS
jgi:uroporphyrinogen-III synthase